MSGVLKSLAGLTAIVTGGSSGLGAATVRRLLDNGCKVVACDLVAPDGNDKPDNKNYLFIKTDITSELEMQQAIDTTTQDFSKNLHVLVNCAGTGIARLTYNIHKKEVHPLNEFDRVLTVNVVGTFNAIRLAAFAMSKNSPGNPLDIATYKEDDAHKDPTSDRVERCPARGVIINTASVAAFEGQRGQVAYSASKGAIVGMTLPLARDLAPLGIRVMAIAPGLFDTPMLAKLPEKVRKFLATTIPYPPRLGHPDEYAHLVQSIITNSMLNGEVIRLDGALRMQP